MNGHHLQHKPGTEEETEDELVVEMLREDWRLTSALLFLSSKLKETEWRLVRNTNLARRKICLGKIVPGDVWEVWDEYLNGQPLGGHRDVLRWELEQQPSGCFFLVESGPAYLARSTHYDPQNLDKPDPIIRWLRPRRWDQALLASIHNPRLRKIVRRFLRLFKYRTHLCSETEMALRRKRFSCLLSAIITQASGSF